MALTEACVLGTMKSAGYMYFLLFQRGEPSQRNLDWKFHTFVCFTPTRMRSWLAAKQSPPLERVSKAPSLVDRIVQCRRDVRCNSNRTPKLLAIPTMFLTSDAKRPLRLLWIHRRSATKAPAKVLRCWPAMRKKHGMFSTLSDARCLRFTLSLRFGLRCECWRAKSLAMRFERCELQRYRGVWAAWPALLSRTKDARHWACTTVTLRRCQTTSDHHAKSIQKPFPTSASPPSKVSWYVRNNHTEGAKDGKPPKPGDFCPLRLMFCPWAHKSCTWP